MRKIVLLIILASLFLLQKLDAQIPDNDLNWDVVFFDDFNSLNTNVWDTNPFPATNFDYHWFTNNVSVSNSNLKITSTLNGSTIETGAVKTKASFGYGFFEAKMKLSIQGGTTWNNAFWLYRGFSNYNPPWGGPPNIYYHDCCNSLTDPTCSAQRVWWHEIDIEVLADNNITSNIHKVYGDCSNSYESGRYDLVKTRSFINDYHTYAISYDRNKVKFFLDDIKWSERSPNVLADSTLWISFMTGFINQTGNVANNTFPGYIYVDWVKYRRLITTYCGTDATINTNSDLASFQYGVRRNISIGNGLTAISLSVGDKKTFRATNEITIKGNFTVPLGSEFNIIPTQCN